MVQCWGAAQSEENVGAYNTVNADLACPSCGATVNTEVQFKYARVNQLHYAAR